jgi:tight adherence protein C
MDNALLLELLAVAAALGFGAVAFLLVRALFPDAFFEGIRQRREELREQAAQRPRAKHSRVSRMVRSGVPYLPLFIEAVREIVLALMAPLVGEAWAERMKLKFLAMGRPEYQPAAFRARQLLYAFVLAAFALVALQLLDRSWLVKVFMTVSFGLFGFFLPYIWLRDQIARRHRAIARALPYHLDLLTLGLEAGLDFAQGLATVVEKGRPGPLLEELGLVVGEMKLGKTREEALRNLSDRVQLAEMSSFVATLVQADKMGTSLGKVLRIQSGQMRVARVQAAEKAANEAPVKMLIPLVLCFFPTMFMILFGPIVYRMMLGG